MRTLLLHTLVYVYIYILGPRLIDSRVLSWFLNMTGRSSHPNPNPNCKPHLNEGPDVKGTPMSDLAAFEAENKGEPIHTLISWFGHHQTDR